MSSRADQLRKQISAATRELNRISLNGATNSPNSSTPAPSTSRRRRDRRRRLNASSGVVAPARQGPVPGRRAAGVGVRSSMREVAGGIRIRRTEFFVDVSDAGSELAVCEKFAWLNKIAKAFDRITWHACRVYYRPAVGTTKDGEVLIGVDWDGDKEGQALTKTFVQALTPVNCHPVWQASTLVLPPSRLMSRREYKITPGSDKTDDYDTSFGNITWYTAKTTTPVGSLWVEYDVSLFGTAA